MRPKTALVLSGGGANGAYEVGVARALASGRVAATDGPLDPDIFAGTSIGAFNAAYLASCWDTLGGDASDALEAVWLDRIAHAEGEPKGYRIRFNPLDYVDPDTFLSNPLKPISRFLGDSAYLARDAFERGANLLGGSDPLIERLVELFNLSSFVVAADWEETIRDVIDFATIRESERQLFVAATNWTRGELRIFDNAGMTDAVGPLAVRASSSIPGFFPQTELEGDRYVDGAVLMNTPLRPAVRAGADVLHVVYMNTDVAEIPVDDVRSTVETLVRTQLIAWAEAMNRDIRRAASYNKGLELLALSRRGRDLPKTDLRQFLDAARPLVRHLESGKRYRPLTIHRYYPPRGLGGILGFLDSRESRIEDVIRQGYRDALDHDCEANGCAIPDRGAGRPGGRPGKGRLEARRLVVLGDDLAVGMGQFAVDRQAQATSFPAQLAGALGTDFAQPLFQAPGVGCAPGLGEVPPIVPEVGQTTVLERLPERATCDNLAVPGFRLADARDRRPVAPLVDRRDWTQTLANLILGLPHLSRSAAPGPTQLEYARDRQPTLALVIYGYRQAIDAALAGDPSLLPEPAAFGGELRAVLRGLGGGCTVLVTTIPDPFDSAYYSSLETAAAILKTLPEFLERHCGLAAGDRLALPGLVEIGCRMMARRVEELPAEMIVDAATAAAIAAALEDLNSEIGRIAGETGAPVHDLAAQLRRLAEEGVEVDGRRLTSGYLGGLYLLNGFFPGATLNALIANGIAARLEEAAGETLGRVDVAAVAAADANTRCELAPGEPATDEFLEPRRSDPAQLFPPLPEPPAPFPIQTTYPGMQPGKDDCVPSPGIPAGGYADPTAPLPGEAKLDLPLRLPKGRRQTLQLNREGSFFGDCLTAVDCPDETPLAPDLPTFGLCGARLFGGPVLTGSRLRGKVEIRFSEPDENNVSRFEIRHPGGLQGEDSELGAPQLFRMPAQLNVFQDVPELVSSGLLDLDTGRVTDFHYNIRNFNTALAALAGVNPGLPPLALLFPGPPNAGSTWARFEPRDDGKLDFTMAAHMFLPLGLGWGGQPLRYALPFGTPDLQTASILARGTALHPQIHLTTRALAKARKGRKPLAIPANSVHELTALSHGTCFGDEFGLNADELGGEATGRSQLMGRLCVQYGPAAGNATPVHIRALPPGGLLADTPPVPPMLPPGVCRGLTGFDTVLEFPKLAYPQGGLASLDDPFNLCVGFVDRRTGRFVDPLLFRAFVIQNLFAALLAVEPCTPADSFNYQGPAALERDAGGELRFRFDGNVFVPYPEGFRFPSPTADGRPAIVIGSDSRLDPFRRIQAAGEVAAGPARLAGGEEGLVGTTGRKFSYRFAIPADPRQEAPVFEYVDHASGGRFRLTALTWLGFTRSPAAARRRGRARADTVTFGGFGTWSRDPDEGRPHHVSVQICLAPKAPYVGILVDGGVTANADTRPQAEPGGAPAACP
jgi:NTE family protein